MYSIIEQQTTGEQTAVVQPIPTRADINEAQSVFFSTCALACVSSVPIHSVTLLREDGSVVKRECFRHEQEQEATA